MRLAQCRWRGLPEVGHSPVDFEGLDRLRFFHVSFLLRSAVRRAKRLHLLTLVNLRDGQVAHTFAG